MPNNVVRSSTPVLTRSRVLEIIGESSTSVDADKLDGHDSDDFLQVTGDLSDGHFLIYDAGEQAFVATDTIIAKLIPRRGTAAEIDEIVLDAGELATTSDTDELRLGDGATAGGLVVGA